MIVKMLKVTLFSLESAREEVLERLRDLGVMHLDLGHVNSPEVASLLEEKQQVDFVMARLRGRAKELKHKITKTSHNHQAKATVDELREQFLEIQKISEDILQLRKEMRVFDAWGSFDPSIIREVQKRISIRLVILNRRQAKEIPESLQYIPCKVRESSLSPIVVVGGDELPTDYITVGLPEMSYDQFQDSIQDKQRSIHRIQKSIDKKINELPNLSHYADELQRSITFHMVNGKFGESGEVVHLSGYVPVTSKEELSQTAKEQGWGLSIEDVPLEDEGVPTLLKNSRFTRLINPILNFIDVVPGYKESDVSLLFLCFFTLFFGIIIGDAGYGFLFLIASVAMMLSPLRKKGNAPFLFALLSLSAIVYGAATGVWFGSEKFLNAFPVLKTFVIPTLYNYQEGGNDKVVMFICFVIALMHLVIARFLNFLREVKRSPHIHAIASLGWIGAIIGLFFVVLNMVVDNRYVVYQWCFSVIGIGLLVAFLFEKQSGKGFFQGVIGSLKDIVSFFLRSIGVFTDIISYIRLYAVGLAGFSIAFSFNEMSSALMKGGGMGVGAAVVLYVLAHTLNIVLCVLGVIVHDVRLNVLEFSSHLGNEWSGTRYSPFK